MKPVQVYKIYNGAELAALSVALRRRVATWSSAWFGTEDLLVETANAYDCGDAAAIFAGGGEGAQTLAGEAALVSLSAPAAAALPALLLGRQRLAAPPCAATEELRRLCLEALLHSLSVDTDTDTDADADTATATTHSAAPVAGDWQRKGAGWVYVQVLVSGLRLPVLLAPGAVAPPGCRRAPARLPAGGGMEAIREQPVRLLAELGSIGLSIGEFRSLKPGDVLRLGTRFADSIVLTTAAGETVCHAVLGKNGGQRAVKIERFN